MLGSSKKAEEFYRLPRNRYKVLVLRILSTSAIIRKTYIVTRGQNK